MKSPEFTSGISYSASSVFPFHFWLLPTAISSRGIAPKWEHIFRFNTNPPVFGSILNNQTIFRPNFLSFAAASGLLFLLKIHSRSLRSIFYCVGCKVCWLVGGFFVVVVGCHGESEHLGSINVSRSWSCCRRFTQHVLTLIEPTEISWSETEFFFLLGVWVEGWGWTGM